MAHVLIMLSDDGDVVSVRAELAPPPAGNPTPAQRVAQHLLDHMQEKFGALPAADTSDPE